MRLGHFLLALAFVAVSSPQISAVDLSKIDRTIAKEPVYQTKTPKYCLLVFGPEAKTRMWLVLDGKVMYVDRNGDGDLTGADEQVPPNPKNGRFELGPFTAAGIEYAHLGVGVTKNDRVQIALFRKEELAHRQKLPLAWGKELQQFAGPVSWTNLPDVQVEERDLQFAARPQDAPIINFDGPLTLKVMDTKLAFVRGDKPTELHVSVGTPGLGKATFTQMLFMGGDPNGVAELVFPHRDPSAKPILVKVALVVFD
jgi:hypothetical protein